MVQISGNKAQVKERKKTWPLKERVRKMRKVLSPFSLFENTDRERDTEDE